MKALILFAAMSVVLPVQDPVYNDRKLSEWQAMLKNDPLPRKRRAAIIALGELAQAEKTAIVPALAAVGAAMRNDASPVVREQAAATLGLQSTDDSLFALDDLTAAMRQEREPIVRVAIAVTLGRFGRAAKQAVGPLTEALSDVDPTVVAASAEALGRIGGDAKAAAAKLLGLVKSDQVPVRRSAVFALGRIEPDEKQAPAVAIVQFLRQEKSPELQREAVLALGLLGESAGDVLPALVERLDSAPSEFRITILETIGRFGVAGKDIHLQLLPSLTEAKDPSVRRQAVRTLAKCLTADEDALIRILAEPLVKENDFQVRVVIVEEFGAIKVAYMLAIPLLRQAQKDPQVQVREAAGAALKTLLKLDQPKKP